MSHTNRLRRAPATFRPLAGITPAAFDQLLAELEPRHEQAEVRRKTRAAHGSASPGPGGSTSSPWPTGC